MLSSLCSHVRSFIEIAVLVHYVGWFLVFGPLFILGFASLFFTPLFPLPIAYIAWCFYDKETTYREGRRFQFVRKLFIWRYFANYFPMELHKTAELDPSSGCYILIHHPHAVLGMTNFINFATEGTNSSRKFPGITFHPLTLNMNLMMPILREYIMACGAGSVSAKSIEYKMTKMGPGQAVSIVVGGAAEAGLTNPDDPYKLVLNKRKGFVKMALKTGASLVPVFSFGETDSFSIKIPAENSRLDRFQKFIYKTFSFYPVIFSGRYLLLPYRKPIHTVVGAPIPVPHIPKPTVEEINRHHAVYVETLRKLFEENVGLYGDPSKKLQIF